MRLWYKRDNTFWVPKGHVYVVLKSWVERSTSHVQQLKILRTVRLQNQLHVMQYSQGIPRFQRWFLAIHASPHRMVANLVCDSLDEITYSASLSGLQYSLVHHCEGLSVRVYGYHKKLPLLLQVVLEKIKNLRLRHDRLEIFKEKVCRSLPWRCASG